ncbi:MAG: right-handed parallel beta-helix repeat-containing protein [Spirochaetales bacterium]|nr:right-handed parallel beta-helix repeat-containing protein [Spirochaetales bacterium]
MKYFILTMAIIGITGCHSISQSSLMTYEQAQSAYQGYLLDLAESSIARLDPKLHKEDNTEYIQSLLDSEIGVLIIPAQPGPWTTGPLFINRDNLTILFEPDARLEAIKEGFQGRNDCLITVRDRKNITLKGFGAGEGLYMRKKDYSHLPYPESEWRHCLSLRSTEKIIVEGLTLSSSGGDGIYLGLSRSMGSNNYCLDTVIRDCLISDNRRQGISVISAENLLIQNVTCRDTRGTLPKAGIDFEPNNPSERLINCRVIDSNFISNRGPGIHIYLKQFDETTRPLDLYFEGNYCRKNLLGIGINLTQLQNKPRGSVTFKDNDFGRSPFNKIPRNKSLEIIELN